MSSLLDEHLREKFNKESREREDAVYRSTYTELLAALKGIMEYAHTGARATDIDPQEQPQFIAARDAIRNGERNERASI